MIFDYDQQRWIGGDDVSLGGFEESESESGSPIKQPSTISSSAAVQDDGELIEEEGVTMHVTTLDGHHAKEMSDYFPIRSFAAHAVSAVVAMQAAKVKVDEIDELLDDLSIPSEDDAAEDNDEHEQAVAAAVTDKKKTDDDASSSSLAQFKDTFSGPATAVEEPKRLAVTDAEQIGDLIMARLLAEAVEVVTQSLSSNSTLTSSDNDRPLDEHDAKEEGEAVVMYEEEDDQEADLTLQSATMTYDHIAKVCPLLHLP